jgi:hypothetical protein
MRSTTPVTQKNEICAEFPSGGQKSNSGHGRATTDRLIAFKRNDGPKATLDRLYLWESQPVWVS